MMLNWIRVSALVPLVTALACGGDASLDPSSGGRQADSGGGSSGTGGVADGSAGRPAGGGGTPSAGFGGGGSGSLLDASRVDGKGGSSASDAGGSGPIARLGRACALDADCDGGLQCLTANSGKIAGEGPANGYCSADCSRAPGVCQTFVNSALCLNFGTDIAPSAWCVLGCEFGPTTQIMRSLDKCFARDDVACAPLFAGTGMVCRIDADCGAGAVCGDGECFQVVPACLPRCNADADCGRGRFCNPRTGMCSATANTGKMLADKCVSARDGSVEECRGTCVGTADETRPDPVTHICSEGCTIAALPACGWTGPASGRPADAACLFSSTAVSGNGGPGVGDLGSCGQLCDCNSQCRNPDFICSANASLRGPFNRRGYCTTPDNGEGGIDPGIPGCSAAGAPADAGGG